MTRDDGGHSIEAVIFDLDGVIVSTDEYHYLGWQRMADEEGIPFDRQINNRLRGVSRMASLEIVLERSERSYGDDEKKALADRKNSYYRDSLESLGPSDILPGAMAVLDGLKSHGVKVAIASSSRNSPAILQAIGLADHFDATSDGNEITHSKPDPEVFLLAAKKLGIEPEKCLVVEDAKAGVEAGLRAGMAVLAVGDAASDERATSQAEDLSAITVDEMLGIRPSS